jgi:cytochrome c
MINFKSAALAALVASIAMPALADGDAEKGEKVFKKCKACHAVGEGAKNKVGPELNGIVDNEAASVEGFKYSKAFMEKKSEGLVWTEDNLETYFKKPKDFIPGTKMSFAGLRKEDDIDNVIAYLETFE